MSIKKLLSAFMLLTCITFQSFSQDTFSIVAVDPVTGEVGSAGASCVDVSNFGTNDASFLGELFPGVGAINTQASYNTTNQANARSRMNAGQTPNKIIQWLVNNDVSNQPQNRQYGIAALVNGQAQSDAYTGSSTMNYKNHITGPNYAIQGNILLGQQILDNMEAGFLNEPGDLSCKLMAALQGANVVGADTRCSSNGTSSLFAFLKVAQPNDQFGNPSFSIAVTTSNGQGIEPIDALQNKFDNEHSCQIVDCNQPCDDNNPCTVNDVFGDTCNCAGTFADADGDGVCDINDMCPNGNDNIDNNNNSTPDACEPCSIYNFNTYPVLGYDSGQDFGPWAVQDGGATLYMTGNAWKAIDMSYTITPQTVITFDFKSTVEGEIHELGFDNNLSLNRDQALVVYGNQGYGGTLNNATYSGSGNWESFTVDIGAQFTGTYQYLVLTADDDANSAGNSYYRNIKIFEDTDGDLACDVQCTTGASCDDNDACTTGETYDSSCNCTGGTLVDTDNDGVCDTNDQCQGIDDSLIGTSCNDNDACTTGDEYDSNCNCTGTFTDSDNDGVCDANDNTNGNCTLNATCDDGDPCTTGDAYDANCNCAGTPLPDSDNDGICDAIDNTNGNCTLNATCDDGDLCTTGATYDNNCNCTGGIFNDSDGDSVCDANDSCAGGDDTIDIDGDGIPDYCDSCPNDAGNACGLPSYCSAGGTNVNYEYISNVTFDVINNTSGANGGYGDFTNLSATASLGDAMPLSLTAGYPGTNYAENWVVWIDFNRDGDFSDNGEEVFTGTATGSITGSVTIPNTANAGATVMRVSMQWNNSAQPCGSFTYGEVEDYTIVLSTNSARLADLNDKGEESARIDAKALKVYPNPASTFINVDLSNILKDKENDRKTRVKIFTTDGKLIKESMVSNAAILTVDIGDLSSNQYYLISINNGDKLLSTKFFKL